MRGLNRRVDALEQARFGCDRVCLDHLTDDELQALLMEVCEDLEKAGHPMPENWRERIERDEMRVLHEMMEQAE